jgi:hypothetical protein
MSVSLTISLEVESTLFRANSFASKLMTYFTTAAGTPFLNDTLKPLLQEVVEKSESYEVSYCKTKSIFHFKILCNLFL